MPGQLRPLLESLEGRMLLSTVHAPTVPVAQSINFVAPGTTTSGVHAVASQQARSVTLTLQRADPSREAIGESIRVEVATGPITISPTPVPPAQPGVQYQPVLETVTFPSGVTSVPVKIPIVAGAANPGMLSFEVTATQLGVKTRPGGYYGEATEDVFLARDIHAPVPRIDGANMVLSGHRTSDIVLHFSLPMNPASVQNVSAYYLSDTTFHAFGILGLLFHGYSESLSGNYGSDPVLKTATYDPSTNIVDLHLAKSVDARDVYQIGGTSGPNATLIDAAGTPINEDGTGLGGGFLITLGDKKATIFDGSTQSVIPASPPRR